MLFIICPLPFLQVILTRLLMIQQDGRFWCKLYMIIKLFDMEVKVLICDYSITFKCFKLISRIGAECVSAPLET